MNWRPMLVTDIGKVAVLANQIHADYPEDVAVFAEKQRLFPQGCAVLEEEGQIVGYFFSHPWIAGKAPILNALLGHLPANADEYYLHDFALAPRMRGRKAGGAQIEALCQLAKKAGFARFALTAVSGSVGFWEKQGFSPVSGENLASYGDEAVAMERLLL